MEHTDWDELDIPVREAIERRSGTVRRVRTVTGGPNSRLALVLDTASGSVFVKGLPADHPGTVRLGTGSHDQPSRLTRHPPAAVGRR